MWFLRDTGPSLLVIEEKRMIARLTDISLSVSINNDQIFYYICV